MFGMDDPQKVVVQYRRMVQEGRLEMAEVMARGLSERILTTKPENRDLKEQGLLVEVTRDLSAIFEIREKFNDSIDTSNLLEREMKRLIKQQNTMGEIKEKSEYFAIQANDLVQRGRVYHAMKKYRKALSCYKKAHKISPTSLEAVFRPFETLLLKKGSLKSSKKFLAPLQKAIQEAGPVQMENEQFILLPKLHLPHSVQQLLKDFELWSQSQPPNEVKSWLESYISNIQSQCEAINRGEQAKNAEMAAAIDKLEVTQDYHEWIGSK